MTVRELSRIGIFAALACIISPLAVPLPFTPVPVSLGVVAVYITGLLLAPKCAFLAQVVYVLLGTFGVPVFHAYTAGPGVLFGPTGGFLFAYPFMATLVSLLMHFSHKRFGNTLRAEIPAAAVACILASCLSYVFASSWRMLTEGLLLGTALSSTVIPFIPMDLLKTLFCVVFIVPVRKRLAFLHPVTVR